MNFEIHKDRIDAGHLLVYKVVYAFESRLETVNLSVDTEALMLKRLTELLRGNAILLSVTRVR